MDTSIFRQSCPNSGFWKSIPFSISPSPQTEKEEANRVTNPPQKHVGHGKTRNVHLTAETSEHQRCKKASQAGAELDPPVALSPWADSCRIWLFFVGKGIDPVPEMLRAGCGGVGVEHAAAP